MSSLSEALNFRNKPWIPIAVLSGVILLAAALSVPSLHHSEFAVHTPTDATTTSAMDSRSHYLEQIASVDSSPPSLPSAGMIAAERKSAAPSIRLVEDALPALDPVRRRVPGADDEGAFLAWVYTLAVDEALDRLSARGLLTPPATASPASGSPTPRWRAPPCSGRSSRASVARADVSWARGRSPPQERDEVR